MLHNVDILLLQYQEFDLNKRDPPFCFEPYVLLFIPNDIHGTNVLHYGYNVNNAAHPSFRQFVLTLRSELLSRANGTDAQYTIFHSTIPAASD